MTKDVTVAELEKHLAERLAEVQTGTTLKVVNDGKTIARIEPETHVAEQRPLPSIESMANRQGPKFPPPRMKWDGAELILIDRGQIREFVTFPDPSFGPLGEWTPPSLNLGWDPVDDLVEERERERHR
jgi:antitoxin (DNA-binding transcriptional repressor) of toxin-antitoxin stability system